MDSKSLLQRVYRYWFYGWLFRDANQGSAFERAAAVRHNRERSFWLPTYLRRWTVLGVLSFIAGVATESMAPAPVALLPFAVSTLSVSVNAVTLAAWLGFKVMLAK